MPDHNATIICGINSVSHVLNHQPGNLRNILVDSDKQRKDLEPLITRANRHNLPVVKQSFQRNRGLSQTVQRHCTKLNKPIATLTVSFLKLIKCKRAYSSTRPNSRSTQLWRCLDCLCCRCNCRHRISMIPARLVQPYLR